ncbi:hypothetical protein [Sporocytophaga myxococcoides]|uniref:hypothetical protein n=1 Tax=Sporocytophaga myxococcoides TaxID=153721 RepID=UPI0003FB83AC|nr:hypothetical protein [Sporocytophaga myxococcoides]
MNPDYLDIKAIEVALTKNKKELYEDSIKLLEECLDTYFEIMLLYINPDFNNVTLFDKSQCIEVMEDMLRNPKSGTLGLRVDDLNVFFQNEICFINSLFGKLPYYPAAVLNKYNHDENILLAKCIQKFFDKHAFNTAPHLNFYEKINVSEADKFLTIGSAFNIENIIVFYEKLVKDIFVEFTFDSKNSTKHCKRYTRQVKENVLFGFELDFKKAIKVMKHGEFYLPTYLNLFVAKMDPLSKKLEKDSIYNLGILGNPFFYSCSMPIERFFIKSYNIDFDNLDKITSNQKQFIYQILKKKQDDGSIEIIFPEARMDLVKKYSCFYYSILNYSSQPYLKYIEKSVIESIV